MGKVVSTELDNLVLFNLRSFAQRHKSTGAFTPGFVGPRDYGSFQDLGVSVERLFNF